MRTCWGDGEALYGWPGIDNGSYRGLRGGSFNNNDNNLHASNRNNNNPTNENNNIGFRVVEAPEALTRRERVSVQLRFRRAADQGEIQAA